MKSLEKEYKALIRSQSHILQQWADGEISYGKMASMLAEALVHHNLYLEEKKHKEELDNALKISKKLEKEGWL